MRENRARYRGTLGTPAAKRSGSSSTQPAVEPKPPRTGVDATVVAAPEIASTPESLLTIEEFAAMLNVGPRFVRRLVAERRISFHKVGHYVRFDAADVAAWIAAGRVDPSGREPRSR